ncbi:MAG: prolipoprotein diacylglyceryl transferase [Chitinophagaceae bacterium]|nr:prolipoprotein diacylglyceryl transferase [Chitinophagaceae bacterium]
MYPDFHELLKSLFGIDIPVLSLLKMFGFLVAMAFLAGGNVLYRELKRKEQEGIVGFTIDEVTLGKPLGWTDYLMSALIGFVVGYKVIGMFADWKLSSPDPMSYLFSSKGNLVFGIVMALGALGIRYFGTKKERDAGIITKKVKTWPHMRVGDIAVISALGGFAGAKIFNAFETWEDFLRDPIGNLFSSSGLTFYGGLIVATLALWYFARKINLDFRHLCDAAAPALILAYGIGRLGCQVSGDGDWGIYNSAYATNAQGKVVPATQDFSKTIIQFQDHLSRHHEPGEKIPYKPLKAPGFLPTWMVAYNYPGNVNKVGVPLQGCEGEYCTVLPMPVFPTPIYEFLMGLIIFGILWGIRKRFTVPLSMFSIYLIFNGIERFFIEQFRVNFKYNWGFIHPTQAEIIAVLIMLSGVLMFMMRKRIDHWNQRNQITD